MLEWTLHPQLSAGLRPGTFTNNEDVYAEAALLSRAARPSANTERCSGSPSSIYPYHSEVLSDDLLSRTCLSTVSEDDDSFGRSPLPVQSSRAEKKVAQDFRGASCSSRYILRHLEGGRGRCEVGCCICFIIGCRIVVTGASHYATQAGTTTIGARCSDHGSARRAEG